MIEFTDSFPEALPFIDAFLNPSETRPKYVFGINHDAIEIAIVSLMS